MKRAVRHARRRACAFEPLPCDCPECAGLDLHFPGEGRQLAFALPTTPTEKARRTRRPVS